MPTQSYVKWSWTPEGKDEFIRITKYTEKGKEIIKVEKISKKDYLREINF